MHGRCIIGPSYSAYWRRIHACWGGLQWYISVKNEIGWVSVSGYASPFDQWSRTSFSKQCTRVSKNIHLLSLRTVMWAGHTQWQLYQPNGQMEGHTTGLFLLCLNYWLLLNSGKGEASIFRCIHTTEPANLQQIVPKSWSQRAKVHLSEPQKKMSRWMCERDLGEVEAVTGVTGRWTIWIFMCKSI